MRIALHPADLGDPRLIAVSPEAIDVALAAGARAVHVRRFVADRAADVTARHAA